jgi:hypothetical protein
MAARQSEQPKLKIPYAPGGESKGHYNVNTLEEKIVRDYTGYDFDRLCELDVFSYWLLLHDAVVYNCQQTEQGRAYLEKCWLLDQTEPDRDSLRKYFAKGR